MQRNVKNVTWPMLLGLACLSCMAADRTDGRAGPESDAARARVTALAGATAPAVDASEYAERRSRLLERIPDGVLLLRARPAEKDMEQWGFVQSPGFHYFTGMAEVPAAILALDGVRQETRLFLPPTPESFGMPVEGLVPPVESTTADRYGVDAVHPWSEFAAWMRERLTEGDPTIYLDGPRRPEATGAPPGLPPLAGEHTLWREALARSFPAARFGSAQDAIMRLRAVKSEPEVAILALNARRTVESLLAAAATLAPGVRQRETEAAVIDVCLGAGGQGPSFWPWTMSGPNAHVDRLVHAFFRYDQGDRPAGAGELVRVDIGCAGGGYGADVGRTLPVSGRFDEGQAEAWDLLVEGYRAGLAAMADGVTVRDVRQASLARIRELREGLETETGRQAAEAVLTIGQAVWHIHGVGIDSGEDIPEVLESGMVVAYEPGISVAGDAYYLEDMVLVTDTGHTVLSAGLPYTADEIARAMER